MYIYAHSKAFDNSGAPHRGTPGGPGAHRLLFLNLNVYENCSGIVRKPPRGAPRSLHGDPPRNITTPRLIGLGLRCEWSQCGQYIGWSPKISRRVKILGIGALENGGPKKQNCHRLMQAVILDWRARHAWKRCPMYRSTTAEYNNHIMIL